MVSSFSSYALRGIFSAFKSRFISIPHGKDTVRYAAPTVYQLQQRKESKRLYTN